MKIFIGYFNHINRKLARKQQIIADNILREASLEINWQLMESPMSHSYLESTLTRYKPHVKQDDHPKDTREANRIAPFSTIRHVVCFVMRWSSSVPAVQIIIWKETKASGQLMGTLHYVNYSNRHKNPCPFLRSLCQSAKGGLWSVIWGWPFQMQGLEAGHPQGNRFKFQATIKDRGTWKVKINWRAKDRVILISWV